MIQVGAVKNGLDIIGQFFFFLRRNVLIGGQVDLQKLRCILWPENRDGLIVQSFV